MSSISDKRFQGIPCFRGHDGIRYISNNECVHCAIKRGRISAKKFREKNREFVRKQERERRRLEGPMPKNKTLLRSARDRARRRGYEFNLTQEWVDERIAKGCVLTGWAFDLEHKGKAVPLSPSIDRIDSEKGYTPDNCRMVCWIVNRALGNFGSEIFLKMCAAILRKM